MTNQSIEERLVAKLQWARNDGSPIAGSSEKVWAKIAKLARRRWFSYERRKNLNKDDNRANRIEDLARGLGREEIDKYGLSSPLMTDYRWLAEQLAEILEAEPQ